MRARKVASGITARWLLILVVVLVIVGSGISLQEEGKALYVT